MSDASVTDNTKTPEQIEHILAVAQWIEDHPEEFDMGEWGWSEVFGQRRGGAHGCNTTLCIGGASDMLVEHQAAIGEWTLEEARITPRFGITWSEAAALCYGDGVNNLTTPEKGVACLRDIAAGRDVLEAIKAQA